MTVRQQPPESRPQPPVRDLTLRSDSLASAIVESTSDAVIGIDRQQRIVLLNRAAEHLFGYRRDELLGEPLDSLLPDGLAGRHARMVRDFSASSHSFRPMGARGLITARRRDGSEFRAEASLARLDVPGMDTVLAAFIRDVSDRLAAAEALAASERRFRRMFEQAAVGIVHRDLSGRFLRFNDRFLAMLGHSRPESEFALSSAIVHPDDLQAAREVLRQLTAHEKPVTVSERRFIHRDGHVVWGRTTSSLVEDDAGEPPYVATIVEDITEQKRIEFALAERAAENQAIIAAVPDLIFRVSRAGVILRASDSVLANLLLNGPPRAGLTVSAVLPPELADPTIEAVQQAMISGEIGVFESSVDAEGLPFRVEIRTIRLDNESALLVFRDVSTRWAAEETLRESERRFQALARGAPAIIYRLTPDGDCVYANARWSEVTGRPVVDALGRGWLDAVIEDDRNEAAAAWAEAVAESRGMRGECRVARADGGSAWLLLQIEPELDEQGRICGFVGTAVDITARKAADDSVRALTTLLQSAIDGLTARIAVVNSDGRVAMVNRAWRASRGVDGIDPTNLDVGADYLGACEPALKKALRELLAGRRKLIRQEFRSGSGNESHWFVMTATRADDDGNPLAVLAYEDVTELKRSELELRSTLNALSASISGIAITDSDGHVTFANESLAHMWGCDRADELLGLPLLDFAADATDGDAIVAAVEATGSYLGEVRGRRRDGTNLDVEVSVSLMRDATGGIVGAIGSFVDITERREAEDRLRHAQRSLMEAQRIARVGHFETDVETGALRWSDELYRIFGIEPEQGFRTYAEFFRYVHPEDRARVESAGKAALKGAPYDLDFRFVRPDGSTGIIHTAGELTFENGRAVRMLGTCQDLTELRKTQEVLSQSEASLRALFDAAREGIILIDLDWRILSFNRPAVPLSNRMGNRPLRPGTPFDEVLVPELLASVHEMLQASGRGESPEFSRLMPGTDGTPFWLEGSFNPVTMPDGKVIGTALIVRDITERKRVDDELLQAQKLDSIGRLAGGIAHDFNNLLTAILGFAHLALSTLSADHPGASDVNDIIAAAERAAALTQQLLTFARRQPATPQMLDANDVISQIHTLLDRLIGNNVRLALELSPEPCPILINRAQIDQVLVNLAVNARDAMPSGGNLHLAVDAIADRDEAGSDPAPGGWVRLRITDTGSGIPESALPHIFEPFFTTKDAGKGTGLGLATSYGIIKQAGGEIVVDSSVGRGTTFEIYLPLVRTTAPSSAGPA